MSKVTPFDTSQVNMVLKAIVDETPPGYRYRTKGDGSVCIYADASGKGACLIGKVAERLGIPLPAYRTPENGTGITASEHFDEYFTNEAKDRMGTVQRRQDDGETWRRSIR